MFSNDKNTKKFFNINNNNLNTQRIIKHKSINNSIEKKIKNSELNNNNYVKEIKKLQCEISLIKNELLNEKTKYEILYHKYNNLKSSIKITNLNTYKNNLNKQKKTLDFSSKKINSNNNNNNNNIFNRNKSNSNFNCDNNNVNSLMNNNNNSNNNSINNNYNGFNLFNVTKDMHSLIGNLLDVLEIFILDDIENTSEDNNYENNNSIKIQLIEEIKNNLIKKLKQIQVNNFEWLDGLEKEIKRIKKWNVNINYNNNSNKSYKKNSKSVDNLKQYSILNNNNSVKNFYKLNNYIYPQTRKNNYRKIINNVSLYSNKNISNNYNNKNLNDEYDLTISNEKDNYTYNNKSFNYNLKNNNNSKSFINNNSLDNIKIKKHKIIYEKNNNFNDYDY